MISDRATQVTKLIFEDLPGNAYYADPNLLSDFLKGSQETATDRERRAVEILRYLLQTYIPQNPTAKDIEGLAHTLEHMGVR